MFDQFYKKLLFLIVKSLFFLIYFSLQFFKIKKLHFYQMRNTKKKNGWNANQL